MKQPLLLTILALATFFYFQYPPSQNSSTAGAASTPAAAAAPAPAVNPTIVIAQAPSSYNRWKTGPNAQTDFEPFAANEQANWNQSSGYTIISGATIR